MLVIQSCWAGIPCFLCYSAQLHCQCFSLSLSQDLEMECKREPGITHRRSGNFFS